MLESKKHSILEEEDDQELQNMKVDIKEDDGDSQGENR